MTDGRQARRAVLRFFGLAVAVTAVSAVAILISVYRGYAIENHTRDHLQFHLESLTQTRAVIPRIADLESLLSERGLAKAVSDSKAPAAPTPSTEISIALYSISQALEAIRASHAGYQSLEFQRGIERARLRFDQVRRSLQDPSFSDKPAADLEAFSLAVFQLDRLHSIEAERALEESDLRAGNRPKVQGIAVAIVAAVAALLVWRLLVQLRSQLKLHEETQAALFENERQLMHAQKMEALGTLVGGVAHDFNNVLTGILGHAEMLLAGTAEDDSRYAGLKEIRGASERAARLIRQLLAFSRSDVKTPQVIDLTILVREMEPMLRRLIPADIGLTLEGPDAPARAEVDVVQIEQVLLNLTTNACDAMPDGGALTIRTETIDVGADDQSPRLPVGSYVRISTRDSGHGIRPEVLNRVFDPFYTTKEQGKGTGLGLSTVHGIVTKSHGFIFVESEIGRGARFDIYLPLTEVEPAPQQLALQSETPRGSETVLVVEDEEQVRTTAAGALRLAGYEVAEASNGADALRFCEDHDGTIDLFLSDVVMPKMRGPEFVKRALAIFPDSAVVFMSGYSEEGVLAEVRRSGHLLILKPFTLQQLLHAVRQELDERATRLQSEQSA